MGWPTSPQIIPERKDSGRRKVAAIRAVGELHLCRMRLISSGASLLWRIMSHPLLTFSTWLDHAFPATGGVYFSSPLGRYNILLESIDLLVLGATLFFVLFSHFACIELHQHRPVSFHLL